MMIHIDCVVIQDHWIGSQESIFTQVIRKLWRYEDIRHVPLSVRRDARGR